VHSGKNVLAVEVIAPTEKDLGINWVDWNPTPPDKNMGLWRGVWLSRSGPLELHAPQVVSHVNTGSTLSADLTVTAQVQNTTERVVGGLIAGRIGRITFSRAMSLAAHETATVKFSPEDSSQLHITEPRLWWPWQMGA